MYLTPNVCETYEEIYVWKIPSLLLRRVSLCGLDSALVHVCLLDWVQICGEVRAAGPPMWSAVVCLLCHFTQLSWKAAGQKREPLLLFQTPTVSSSEAFKPPPPNTPPPPAHIYIYIFFFLISIYFFIMSTFYWVDLWRTFTRNCFFFPWRLLVLLNVSSSCVDKTHIGVTLWQKNPRWLRATT